MCRRDSSAVHKLASHHDQAEEIVGNVKVEFIRSNSSSRDFDLRIEGIQADSQEIRLIATGLKSKQDLEILRDSIKRSVKKKVDIKLRSLVKRGEDLGYDENIEVIQCGRDK